MAPSQIAANGPLFLGIDVLIGVQTVRNERPATFCQHAPRESLAAVSQDAKICAKDTAEQLFGMKSHDA